MSDPAATYVAVLLVDVEMPWVHSLKQKRAIMTPLVERLRHRFALSVARLDGLDAHGWERIGLAAVGNDRVVLERMLDRALVAIAAADVRVVRQRLDLEVWDGL